MRRRTVATTSAVDEPVESIASPIRRARSITARACRWLTASSPPGTPIATVGGPTPRTTHWARSRHALPTRGAGRSAAGRTWGPVISDRDTSVPSRWVLRSLTTPA
jgi:hypothetical protein